MSSVKAVENKVSSKDIPLQPFDKVLSICY